MRKLLHRFEHPWQAEIFQGLLKQESIQSFTIEGAREYATIVTGIGQPLTELFVDESDLDAANKVLTAYLRKPHLHIVEEDHHAEAAEKLVNHFRRILFFSLAGAVFLPVILNIFAVYHLLKFLKLQDETLWDKFIAVTVTIAGWLGSAVLIYETLRHFLK